MLNRLINIHKISPISFSFLSYLLFFFLPLLYCLLDCFSVIFFLFLLLLFLCFLIIFLLSFRLWWLLLPSPIFYLFVSFSLSSYCFNWSYDIFPEKVKLNFSIRTFVCLCYCCFYFKDFTSSTTAPNGILPNVFES